MKISILIWLLFISTTTFSQSSEEYYQMASDRYDEEDYLKAISYLNLALVADSTNAKYLYLKGLSLEKRKEYHKALDIYSLIMRYHPENSWSYNQHGVLLMSFQRPEDAVQDFSKALAFEKTDTIRVSLLVNRGAANIDIRNYEEAYKDFIEALQIDSLNIGILNNLAAVCDEVGKGDQTLKYLYKIIQIDSSFIGAYANIGFKHQEMGDYKTAIQFYDKVLELDPNEPLGYSNRAYNKYKLGEFLDALSDINTSIKLYPSNSYAFRIRSLVYLSLKQKSKACMDIDEALQLGFTKMYGDEVEKLKKENCK